MFVVFCRKIFVGGVAWETTEGIRLLLLFLVHFIVAVVWDAC